MREGRKLFPNPPAKGKQLKVVSGDRENESKSIQGRVRGLHNNIVRVL
jgi:hypothetical protein